MSDILYDSGVLSDVDIREFWGKGIEIDTYQKGDWAFDLDKQLQLGSIDLRFRPDYKKFNLNEKDTIKYDSSGQYGLLSRHFCTQICSEKLLDGGV